jgi:hypothetical protein
MNWHMLADQEPVAVGWYPVLLCWEAEEGFFPAAAYWNGEAFADERAVSNWLPKQFATKAEAEAMASEWDPDW